MNGQFLSADDKTVIKSCWADNDEFLTVKENNVNFLLLLHYD
jgi:hypothetical protein